jgi:predicted nuclease of predicted toxin-antitoxin system
VSLRLLLDESISPILVRALAQLDVEAESVAQAGLSGQADGAVFAYALEHGMTVVMIHPAEFVKPAEMETCPGLILLRESGLGREGQWARLKPAVRFLKQETGADFLLNRVVDIPALDWFYLMQMAEAQAQ